MKTIFALLAILAITGCSSIKTVPVSHEQHIGAVQITYDDDGNWTKIVSSGVAPLHNPTPHAMSEATKVAAMHAKQSLAEFMSNSVTSEKTADIVSKSEVHADPTADKVDDMTTFTTVVEHIRDNSSAILRGTQITNQSSTRESTRVEITVTHQSIQAANSILDVMNGDTR
jgi:hypothetical protein